MKQPLNPRLSVQYCPDIFFCNVIVIANGNTHFVIVRSENVKERVISQGTLE